MGTRNMVGDQAHEQWLNNLGKHKPRGLGETVPESVKEELHWDNVIRTYWGDITEEYNANRMEALRNGWITENNELTELGKDELRRLVRVNKMAAEDKIFEKAMDSHKTKKDNAVVLESRKYGVDIKKYGKITKIEKEKYKVEYYGKPAGGNRKKNVVLEYTGTTQDLITTIEFQREKIQQVLRDQGVWED